MEALQIHRRSFIDTSSGSGADSCVAVVMGFGLSRKHRLGSPRPIDILGNQSEFTGLDLRKVKISKCLDYLFFSIYEIQPLPVIQILIQFLVLDYFCGLGTFVKIRRVVPKRLVETHIALGFVLAKF